MTDGTNAPGNERCVHGWRIVDTRVDRMHGPDKNPVFDLKCRTCGAEIQAKGQIALKRLSAGMSISTSLG